MLQSFVVTSKMMEDLEYDSKLEELNIDTQSVIQTPPNEIKFDAIKTPKASSEDFAASIEDNLNLLATIESDENYIPFDIVKQHIQLGLDYYKNKNFCKPNTLEGLSAFTPILVATHDISLLEVLHNLFLIIESKCNQMLISYDSRRQKLLRNLYSVLKLEQGDAKCEEEFVNSKEICDQGKKHFPYTSMFIFDSGDLESAAYWAASSFNDLIIPWRVRCIYVQESCYDDFCARLKAKLRPYPTKIVQDEEFMENCKNCVEKIVGFQAKILKNPAQNESGEPMPIVCHEFNRSYFDTETYLSPIIILKQFRTAKEALTLAKIETGGLASIWSDSITLAYDLAQKLDFYTVWINCLGKINPSIPFSLRENSNCLGSDFAFVDFFANYFPKIKDSFTSKTTRLNNVVDNGWKTDSSYHYQYSTKLDNKIHKKIIKDRDGKYKNIRDILNLKDPYWESVYDVISESKVKTIVFPFGTIFAN